MSAELSLVVRRVIAAPPVNLFDAWTTPERLLSWFGPRGVRCTKAEVDLRVGGRYRLDNLLPDGKTLVIGGEFLEIERPARLVYTWRTDPHAPVERVTVRFEPRGVDRTEVIVVHEHIADALAREGHDAGWVGCLERLAAL